MLVLLSVTAGLLLTELLTIYQKPVVCQAPCRAQRVCVTKTGMALALTRLSIHRGPLGTRLRYLSVHFCCY